MVGFPEFFHVNAGHPVLEHPLYQKYNQQSIMSLMEIQNPINILTLEQDLCSIMLTNHNWPIIWYLSNVLRTARLCFAQGVPIIPKPPEPPINP